MNKTIIINIGGTIFHIEEDAYEILKNYMTEVKRSLNANSDSFEIVADIENRFAELFTHFLENQGKQVIVAADVNAVIAQMGNPSDFDDTEGKEEFTNSDKSDFGGTNSTNFKRRLFRDPDDKIIGGVCSGVAHYFDIDPLWVRLTLGFLFFLGGVGLIPYIIFWIAVPAAKTRADKISMKGGVVNFDTLKQSVEQELKDVGSRANDFRKEHLNKDTSSRIRGFFEEVFEVLGKILVVFIKVIGIGIGLLFLTISGIILIAFFIAMIAMITKLHTDVFLGFPFNVIPYNDQLGVLITVFVLVIIPLILLFTLGLRIIFKKIQLNGPIVQGMAVVWFIALGFGAYFATKISDDYRHHAVAKTEISLISNPKNTFRLKMEEDLFADSLNKEGYLDPKVNSSKNNPIHFKFGGDYEFDGLHGINFKIEKTDEKRTYLTERFTATGPTFAEAAKTASQVIYPLKQEDSIIRVGNQISYPTNKPYRGQDAVVTLYLPVGTALWIDQATEDWLGDLKDDQEYTYNGKPENIWVMTDKGLKPKFGTIKIEKDPDDL